VAITGGTITGIGSPSGASDVAIKSYVDALTGSSVATKLPVKAATTVNISLGSAQVIDGVSVVAGDRVLVKNQTTGANNGIYVVASGAWSRATDFDTSADVTAGLTVVVVEGSTNGGKVWLLTTSGAITLGVTSLAFTAIANPTPAV